MHNKQNDFIEEAVRLAKEYQNRPEEVEAWFKEMEKQHDEQEYIDAYIYDLENRFVFDGIVDWRGCRINEEWERYKEKVGYYERHPEKEEASKAFTQACIRLETKLNKEQKYVFIDIDGVLNCGSTGARNPYGNAGIEKKKLDLLKKIVDETEAEIVLISDWRLSFLPHDEFPEMADYITKKLSSVGLTLQLVSDVPRYEDRADEIRRWFEKHPCKGFVILDDDDFSGYHDADLMPHWIRTQYRKGLTEEESERAIAILKISPTETDTEKQEG